jgi:tetratricopeptide (TPR) repeat protein
MVGLGLAACSAERNGLLGKAYHNTTARYNAYFLGNERLKTLEVEIAAKIIPDYNYLLPIFPVIDSVTAGGLKKELEEIIKKASYPIQKHTTSDWTDDSYLLIGKARFMGLQYDEAIKTFKYVNSTSTNEVTRHEALVWLMRSFINAEDLESAKAVSDIMKKQFLTKENAALLFLTRAHYYVLVKDNKLAIDNLKLAIPLIEKKDEKARIRFILAQLYQQDGQDKMAQQQFNKVLRKNPPYELGFQSKLHLGQVIEVTDASSKETVYRYYRKLRQDAKNKDYLDKIYYEMARFELKQNKPQEALKYLNESVRAATANPVQKGYGYLLAGKIYYEKLQRYNLAQAYYDSAVQVLPPTVQDYAAAAERRDVLNEFVKHYNVVTREDSLQSLAALDQTALNARIDAIIKLQEEQKAAAAQKAAEAAARAASAGPNDNRLNNSRNNAQTAAFDPAPGGVWYFDNPITIGSAKSEFIRQWGNRPLQDNWRISAQQNAGAQRDLVAISPGALPGTAPAAAADPEAVRKALLQDIPLSPEMRATSNQKIEEGLFALANIYRLSLAEPAQAIETYEKLLARFPASRFAPEVNYSLYLLYKEANNPKQNTYAARIKQQFPNSRYAQLIDDPNYLAKVSAGNLKVRQLYDSAFTFYKNSNYAAATNVVNLIGQKFPEANLQDNISFLRVLIIAKTKSPETFKAALQEFLKNNPNSNLRTVAQQYLNSFAAYESGKLSEAEFDKTHPELAKPPVLNVSKNVVTTPPPTAQPAPPPVANKPATQPTTNAKPANNPVGVPPVVATNPPANTSISNNTNNPNPTPPANTTPAAAPPKSLYTVNLQSPQVVVIIYPKGQAAFAGMADKMKAYNDRYNRAENFTVETAAFNANQEMLVIREFTNGPKAKSYTIKQKAPQSPLSKIRGIEFATFVISSENLPILLKDGNLEAYLTFYKNNY